MTQNRKIKEPSENEKKFLEALEIVKDSPNNKDFDNIKIQEFKTNAGRYDFALYKGKDLKFLIELDDSIHMKRMENKEKKEGRENDIDKNNIAIFNEHVCLLRFKSSHYLYGYVNDFKIKEPHVDFIKPYGKALLIKHIQEALELAKKAKEPCVIFCPDGQIKRYFEKKITKLFDYTDTDFSTYLDVYEE